METRIHVAERAPECRLLANRVDFKRRLERPVYPQLRTLDRPRPGQSAATGRHPEKHRWSCFHARHKVLAMNSSILINEAGLGFRFPSSHSRNDSSSTDAILAASSCVTPNRRRAASSRSPNVHSSPWGSYTRNFINRGQNRIGGSFLPFSHPINVHWLTRSNATVSF